MTQLIENKKFIYASVNCVIIGWRNVLLPVQSQAITSTIVDYQLDHI